MSACDYIGSLYALPATTTSSAIQWQGKATHRIFAYLRPSMAACEAILTALQSLDAEVICAVPGISSEWKARYNRLRIFDHPVDLQPLLSHADLAITYGAGTIATALLAGVPVMLVPQMAEQYLAGLPLERMGAGLMLREQQSIEQCASLINTLLTMPSYRQAAQAFAQRYANFSTEQACQRLWSAMKVKLEN